MLTEAYSEGPDTEPRGGPVKHWAPPVEQWAIAIGPLTLDDPLVEGHDRLVLTRKLYVPPEFRAGHRDRVTLPEPLREPLLYEVVGYPDDYTLGPGPEAPGLVVTIRRIEG